MKFHSDQIQIDSEKDKFFDLTEKIQNIVSESNISDGLCNIFVQHTSCFLVLNENDADLKQDFLEFMYDEIPQKEGYNHSDGNAHAHLKGIVFDCEKTLPISNGKLDLGTWQSVLFIDPDGPRDRKILIKALGD